MWNFLKSFFAKPYEEIIVENNTDYTFKIQTVEYYPDRRIVFHNNFPNPFFPNSDKNFFSRHPETKIEITLLNEKHEFLETRTLFTGDTWSINSYPTPIPMIK